MKRIIRLTESDLARIVRRVIKEQSEENTISLKVYETKKDADMASNSGVFKNIDLSDIELNLEYVTFNYTRPGAPSDVGTGSYPCKNNPTQRIDLNGEDFYPTKIGIQKLEPFCQRDKYAKNGSSSTYSGIA
jgi:hypothetical protein